MDSHSRIKADIYQQMILSASYISDKIPAITYACHYAPHFRYARAAYRARTYTMRATLFLFQRLIMRARRSSGALTDDSLKSRADLLLEYLPIANFTTPICFVEASRPSGSRASLN